MLARQHDDGLGMASKNIELAYYILPMNSIISLVKEWYPDIQEEKYWGCIIIGVLLSFGVEWLVKRFDSEYYEWKIAKCLLIIEAVLLLCLLIISAHWQWYFLLILPWGYFLVRYIYFKEKYKRMKTSLKPQNQDLLRFEYLLKLERSNLCSWEVRRFLFPAMNVLFEIGAMAHLDKQLSLLKDSYGGFYGWKRLKSYLCSNRQEFSQMLALLKSYEDDKHLSREEKNRTILNLFHAYCSLDNEEGVRTYILRLEEMVYERKEYPIEALDDLLYHYEITHNEEGVNKILEISNNIHAKDFSLYLEYIDLQYMHNKRIGDVEGNRRLLDEMTRKQVEMNKDDEQKLRFGLRLLKLLFENNYAWKEYSINLFRQAETYLQYSQDIAFEYMEAVMLILQNAQNIYNISLPVEQVTHLLSTIRNYIDKYMLEYDKQITALPNDFVYRKRGMLMHKVTYTRLVGYLIKNEPANLKEVCRLENQIIELCCDNGEEREALHFIVVLTDEILAFYDNIQKDIDNGIRDTDIVKAANERSFFMEQVKHNMEKIDNVLRVNRYNRSLAYYIFYQSYFNFKVGNIENARYALRKFEDTNVSISNFTIAIQMLYKQVKENINTHIDSVNI